jgi:uncharacterized protein (DUF342 family)
MNHPPLKTIRTASFVDTEITFQASDDDMKLFISTSFPPGAIPVHPRATYNGQNLLQYIRGFFPDLLIHEEVVMQVADDIYHRKVTTERRIAKGYPPKKGDDGRLIFLARRVPVTKATLDLTQVKSVLDFENMTPGRIVARIYPPKAGTPGATAFGVQIPAEDGKPYNVEFDSSLQRVAGSPFDTLIAQHAGMFVDDAGTLSICDSLTIEGDISPHFGVIEFVGSLTIVGSLLQKASVRAQKGVRVLGNVLRDASIVAAEGDIIVSGSVENRARLLCAGVCHANRLQGAYLEARQGITVTKDAIMSTLKTHGSVDFSNASFMSGTLLSGSSSVFQELGSATEGEVRLHISSDVASTKDYQELLEHIHAAEKLRELLKLHLGPFALHPEHIERLGDDAQQKMKMLLDKLQRAQDSIQSLEKKREVLARKVREKHRFSDDLSVRVLHKMYVGTTISINTLTWTCHQAEAGPLKVVSKDGKKIIIEKG